MDSALVSRCEAHVDSSPRHLSALDLFPQYRYFQFNQKSLWQAFELKSRDLSCLDDLLAGVKVLGSSKLESGG